MGRPQPALGNDELVLQEPDAHGLQNEGHYHGQNEMDSEGGVESDIKDVLASSFLLPAKLEGDEPGCGGSQ